MTDPRRNPIADRLRAAEPTGLTFPEDEGLGPRVRGAALRRRRRRALAGTVAALALAGPGVLIVTMFPRPTPTTTVSSVPTPAVPATTPRRDALRADRAARTALLATIRSESLGRTPRRDPLRELAEIRARTSARLVRRAEDRAGLGAGADAQTLFANACRLFPETDDAQRACRSIEHELPDA